LRPITLDDEDRALPSVIRRINAPKKLRKADTVLDRTTAKQRSNSYLESLANEVLDAHVPGTQTLVIVNRVERAQRLTKLLASQAPELPRLLLHARFRETERREKERLLRGDAIGDAGRIIVATQAIEAGVDISSRVLFTELAPWASLVQRFGRCNRGGEFDTADVRGIDISDDADEALPYTSETLGSARRRLAALDQADPASLPEVDEPRPPSPVIRRRDFLNLFNTDPDLAGYDVDVAPYIRDSGIPSVHVYWRDFGDRPGDDTPPAAEELCPVSISQLRQHLGANKAWSWDALAERFTTVDDRQLRPGMTLLLRASDGGYDQELGFVHDSKGSVEVIAAPTANADDAYDRDPLTVDGVWVALVQHLSDVKSAATHLCRVLEMSDPLACALIEAAQMHDVGKAHPAFQEALRRTVGDSALPAPEERAPWAKSGNRGRLVYAMPAGEGSDAGARPHFRHELASALAWLANPGTSTDIDLVAYLIAAHHGKVRMSLCALPGEREPSESDRLFARGIWDGDSLPEVDLGGHVLPSTILDLSLMELGMGDHGPSWTDRTQRLLECYGPFRLAWLESLLRVADWRASALERQGGEL
jgi:CRISPR-associated endonuclease/helicase Cas3